MYFIHMRWRMDEEQVVQTFLMCVIVRFNETSHATFQLKEKQKKNTAACCTCCMHYEKTICMLKWFPSKVNWKLRNNAIFPVTEKPLNISALDVVDSCCCCYTLVLVCASLVFVCFKFFVLARTLTTIWRICFTYLTVYTCTWMRNRKKKHI